MFAEITIHSKSSLNAVQFFDGVPRNGSLADAVAKTRFSKTPDTANYVIYWDDAGGSVTLVFADGANGLRAYIENHVDAASISRLKRTAQKRHQMLRDVGKSKGTKFDQVEIDVYGEENLLQHGTCVTLLSFLKEHFIDKVLSSLLIALAGAIVSLLTGKDQLVAVWTFLGILIALGIRTVIEGLRFKGGFNYADT
jgi:hypothetical protein